MKIIGVLLAIIGGLFSLVFSVVLLGGYVETVLAEQVYSTLLVSSILLFSCGCVLLSIEKICNCIKNK